MLGSVSYVLVAAMLHGAAPATVRPVAAPDDAPPMACSITRVADTSDFAGDRGESCFSSSPDAPDNMIFFMPVLQGQDDLEDDTTQPTRYIAPAHAPRTPGGPASTL